MRAAALDGEVMVMLRAGLEQLVAVRYSWGSAEPVNALYNPADLPLPAFRTDDWPMR